ncbi:MAG: alpha/beta hydrolase [Acetatifactor sp.]
MLNTVIKIQVEGSLPEAHLTTYIQEHYEDIDIDKRPLVLICPGGAYAYTSVREGEALALQFLAMGYHAAVLDYSCAPARFPTALAELASAMALIRNNAEKWHVDPEAVIVLGASAGGHLAASMGMLWEEEYLSKAAGLQDSAEFKAMGNRLFRPDGMILCYPVINSGEYAHRESFQNLLGEEEGRLEHWYEKDSLLSKMSLETRVTEQTPPAFVWHTYTDGAVPVENSLLLVSALRKAGVPVEFHMYPRGGHGLSLANRLTRHRDKSAVQEECTSWISLVHTWIESGYVAKS